MSTLQYLYQDNFQRDCDELKKRGIPFKTDGLSISVHEEHEVVLVEFKMAGFIRLGDTIGIVNNDGQCFGHTKSKPLTCPKVAAVLLKKAHQKSRSWYYILNPQDNDLINAA